MTSERKEHSSVEALRALVDEMEYVLSCINEDRIPYDGDDFHEALRLGKEALMSQPKEWQGLSVLEINDLAQSTPYDDDGRYLVEKTEALLKEKNT